MIPQVPPPQAKNGRTPIPVEMLTFFTQSSPDIPGKRQATSCKRRSDKRKGWEIAYYPWLRSFRIDFYPGVGEPPMTRYLLEHHVMGWEPCEGVAL